MARLPWSTAWRIARRDLSARFRGLRLLLVCLFLGVGALAAIGTLTASIERELSTRGRTILGGDIELSVWQRGLTAPERAALGELGQVSEGTRMQAMASVGDTAVPVELKAVDAVWPMVGRLRLADGRLVGGPPRGTAWIASGAAERLRVSPGDRFVLGGEPVTVGGIIANEPDRLGEGFALGPAVIADIGLPQRAGLTAPGSMYRSKTRVLLRDASDPQGVADALKERFPSAGFETRTSDRAAPGAERFVARMGEFLTLVGLAALVIAGIGIGGGVTSYLEARRGSIATLKVLGATSGDIARIYLLQIFVAALAGSLAGLAAGTAITPLFAAALGELLPVTPGMVIDPAALATAAAYGMLVALVFAAPPLLRARRFPALALLRAHVSPLKDSREAWLPVGLGVAAISLLALVNAADEEVTASFLAGSAAVLALLGGLGWAIRRAAARAPRPKAPMLRIALANLHRPGAQTGALVTALGFGLSAFVCLAAIETSLQANIAAQVPQRAPDFFVMDVPRDQLDAFEKTVRTVSPNADIRAVPALRGAVLAFGPAGGMTRVADLQRRGEGGGGGLRGERGLTYSDTVPEGNTLTAGEWWPAGYAGPPLVSVDEEFAERHELELGDQLTIGLLGVERTATIASFRRIDWDSMGFNYILVFSPNALIDAPHKLAATIDLPEGQPSGPLLRQLVRALPGSSVIEVGGLLTQARDLLGQIGTAILAAASVAVLAGLAVLLGAIAAARAARMYDSVILRVLGASRRQLLLLQLAEYGLLAAILAGVALALGSIAGWLVIVQLFEFDWLPDWGHVMAVLGAGLALVIGFALAGSLPLLRARPARVLREL